MSFDTVFGDMPLLGLRYRRDRRPVKRISMVDLGIADSMKEDKSQTSAKQTDSKLSKLSSTKGTLKKRAHSTGPTTAAESRSNSNSRKRDGQILKSKKSTIKKSKPRDFTKSMTQRSRMSTPRPKKKLKGNVTGMNQGRRPINTILFPGGNGSEAALDATQEKTLTGKSKSKSPPKSRLTQDGRTKKQLKYQINSFSWIMLDSDSMARMTAKSGGKAGWFMKHCIMDTLCSIDNDEDVQK